MNLCSFTKNKLLIPVQVGSPTSFLGVIIISLDIRRNRDDITTAMLSKKIGRIGEYKEVEMLHRINKKESLEFNLRGYPAVKPRSRGQSSRWPPDSPTFIPLLCISIVCRVSWWIATYYWCGCSFLDEAKVLKFEHNLNTFSFEVAKW